MNPRGCVALYHNYGHFLTSIPRNLKKLAKVKTVEDIHLRQHKSRVEGIFHNCYYRKALVPTHFVKCENDTWHYEMSSFGKFNQLTRKGSLKFTQRRHERSLKSRIKISWDFLHSPCYDSKG